MIKGLLLDIGGVLTEDGAALPDAVSALSQIRASGLPLRLLTNTSRRNASQVLNELRALKFDVADDELITAPIAVKHYLQRRQLRPYIIATPALQQDFVDIDDTKPNAVVVFDAAEGFSYQTLDAAFQYLQDGAELVAVGDNKFYRSAGRLHLDAGPFIKALEYAAGTQAEVIGKPSNAFYQSVVNEMGLAPDQVMMVGDDVVSDVLGASAAGLQSCLCCTGKYQRGDELKAPNAIMIAEISQLLPVIAAG
ncbi:HAD-superfamily subfamily IIA hydrolase, TIGR01458 [Spongiibacter sp. IMCC21906]|uniref:TIGR01458 family HAD-type hydrolase n=1 Tax=Spongiibacter sp. IMCC21906 TaxID=1620392 RepID=UPI00062DD0F9|nr:TIGR01458 family HAD-type hydrolase [Spongiibacter sp. IMCC21906]AKH68148.1 HAD-superfamily subfamily IIA hydrolase, TIGR01458 [Spongiibacter sp. IMCC21906]